MTTDSSALVAMCLHFALLSTMAVGGGVVMLAPDIHRYVVDANHWMTNEQFSAAYTIAQAAPGPNLLYVSLIGWQVAGWAGALLGTAAIIVPPLLITLAVLHITGGREVGQVGRAIRSGLAPVSVGLMAASGWILVRASDADWRGVIATAVTVLIVMRTRINPVWLIAVGAAAGLAGLV